MSDLEWNDEGLLVRTSKDDAGGKGYVCDADLFWWSQRPDPASSAPVSKTVETQAVESEAMETDS